MEISSDIRRRLEEATYLTTPNANRYRAIVRLLYYEHQSMNYWISKEEIYNKLKGSECFEEYTIEQCENDLLSLRTFKNLDIKQENRYVTNIREYLKRHYTYSLTDITARIESAIIDLENLHLEETSVNTAFLKSFKNMIEEFPIISSHDFSILQEKQAIVKDYSNIKKQKFHEMMEYQKEVGVWWEGLTGLFQKINGKYKATIRLSNDMVTQDKLTFESYLLRKDQLMDLLGTFISELQSYGGTIQKFLKYTLDDDMERKAIQNIVMYYKDIQILRNDVTDEDIFKDVTEKWTNIKTWFMGTNLKESERKKVEEKAIEIIKKLLSFANKFTENLSAHVSREEEYKKVAELFYKIEDIKELNMLSAYVFGVFHMQHLQVLESRKKASTDLSVYDEEPYEKPLKIRTRKSSKKLEKDPIKDKTAKKKELIVKRMTERKRTEKTLKSYIVNGEIDFKSLPILKKEERDMLLAWIHKGNVANRTRNKFVKNMYGQIFYIMTPSNDERCTILCEDGELDTLAYKIRFIEEEDNA